mgnify:CR=1 FL=1
MAIENTLNERESRYGSFAGHASIAQALKQVMHHQNKWLTMNTDQMEALDMIQHKIARILNGDPDYIDSWHDIAGYATLVEQRLSNDIQLS